MPPKFKSSGREFNVLELGPGDSLFTVVIAKTLGATKTYLLDANAIATKDMAKYRQLNRFLRENKFTLPYKSIPKSLDSFMTKCGGIYLTEGKNSLQKIASNSINFCFSNSVLQHIPKQDFSSMAEELFRVMKKRSFAIHSVDFTDLMSGSVDFDKPTSGNLNNLRFPETLWESQFFSRSGFYTNRLRLNDMLKAFTAAGFTCRPLNTIYWPQLPIDRNKLAASFRGLSNDDLLVKHSHIVLQKT